LISHTSGEGSGAVEVAKIMARVFPAYRDFAATLTKEYPSTSFTFGPYPKDLLIYKSKKWVEYKTQPSSDGLGTRWMKKNGTAIEGVAMLVGQTPDLVFLSVRLPRELDRLTSVIVRQVERDAERSDYH